MSKVQSIEVEVEKLDDPALNPSFVHTKFVDRSLLDESVEKVATATMPTALPLKKVEGTSPIELFTSNQTGDQDVAGRAEETLLVHMREDDEARRREREYENIKHVERIKADKAIGSKTGWQAVSAVVGTTVVATLDVGVNVATMHTGFKMKMAENVRDNRFFMGHLSKVLGEAPAVGANQRTMEKFGRSMSKSLKNLSEGAKGLEKTASTGIESLKKTNESDKGDAEHASHNARNVADAEQKDEDRLGQLYDRMVETNQRAKDRMSANAGG